MERKYEIVREEEIGNLHRIYFRRKHETLYGDYDNYVISNEGRKNYYQVCFNGLNGLWFEMSAKTLDEILEKYGQYVTCRTSLFTEYNFIFNTVKK